MRGPSIFLVNNVTSWEITSCIFFSSHNTPCYWNGLRGWTKNSSNKNNNTVQCRVYEGGKTRKAYRLWPPHAHELLVTYRCFDSKLWRRQQAHCCMIKYGFPWLALVTDFHEWVVLDWISNIYSCMIRFLSGTFPLARLNVLTLLFYRIKP